MNMNDFFDYKNKLMQDLCSNENIVKLVTGNEHPKVPNHDLAYTQIFPYGYVPSTENESRTFICFDTDVASVSNKTFYIPVIHIWVLAHDSKMRLPNGGGVIVDKLCSEIDRVLNGSWYYGLGHLDLATTECFKPIQDYMGRSITYYARDFNRPQMQRPIPNNRKKGE